MLGVNHQNAPIEVREKLAFNADEALVFKKELIESKLALEVVIISTCNRAEIYLLSNLTPEKLVKWWLFEKKLSHDYTKYIQIFSEKEALRHLMRVASGLESMVLGEPQILGQIRKSYLQSLENKFISNELIRFFSCVFSAAKEIRHKTDIGKCPVSVAFSAVNLARDFFENLSDKNVLILGAGETSKLVAQHIQSLNPNNLSIINRSYDNAKNLALKVSASAYSLDQLNECMIKADVIISALTTETFLIKNENLEVSADKKQKLLIDLSVPRSIDPKIKSQFNTLYSIDNLEGIIRENKALREKASLYARPLIEEKVIYYFNEKKARLANSMIKNLRSQTDLIAQEALERSIKKLHNGLNPEAVLAELVHNLKNKWLHKPSVMMRQAAIEEKEELLNLTQELFSLPKLNQDTKNFNKY